MMLSTVEPGRPFLHRVQRLTRGGLHLVSLVLGSSALLFFVTRSIPVALSFMLLGSICSIAAWKRLAALRVGGWIFGQTEIDPRRESRNPARAAISGVTESAPRPMERIVTLNPETGVSPQELLRIAASAVSLCQRPAERAIVEEAVALGVPLRQPEDVHYLAGKAVHCWIDHIPTLVGTRPFLTEMGVFLPSRDDQGARTTELFVAQGNRLLGAVMIRDISPFI